MATYSGDPRARLELAYCAILATGPIKHKRESLIGKTAVCWLTGNSHDTVPHHVVDVLEELHISRHELKVVKHFPEQYLVLFSDYRAYHQRRVFNFEAWTERHGTVETMLEYRVRLRIEGVLEVVAKNIEGHSRRQDHTKTYDLWAWSSNPSKIPKKVLLIITDPDRELAANEMHHEPLHAAKGTFDYKLHLHLDVVEDLSFLHGGVGGNWPPNRKAHREFLWNYGALDSLGERRAASSTTTTPTTNRDDHDDNFNRGTWHHHSQSTWGRATRCRGAVEDCYISARTRHRGSNQGHRNRTSTHGVEEDREERRMTTTKKAI
uniref:Uncharacterized protein n=1 Tax=Setaria italica TaxID=4555 RepID=K4AJ16_SETIT